MDRIIHGDEPAFVELYRRHGPPVYRFAYGMCGIKSIAEDCAQEVFLNVLENGTGYRKFSGSVRSWLYGIARHKVIDKFRQRGRLEFGLDVTNVGDDTWAPDQCIAARRRIDEVRRAIVALPVRYREAIVLCELEELSYAEAAGTVDCPVGTIRSRLHRAREMLATRLRSRAGLSRRNEISG